VEACREWDIHVTATAVTDEGTAVVLAADRSGSMARPSGLENLSRMEVLTEAGGILTDVMRVRDALGVVGFSSSADTAADVTDIAGEEATSAERTTLKGKINDLVPGGGTSIGAGVVLSSSILAGASRPLRGMIVMTDGHENTAPFIADVKDSIGVPVYVIGMGSAEVIRPDALNALTTATGGALVLTDTLENDGERYLVAKYALQMLAGVTGAEVVLDPATFLRPEQGLSCPFSICSEDRTVEVAVLTRWPELVKVRVESPARVVVPDAGAGIRRILGRRVACYRLALPFEGAHDGTWNVSVSFADERAVATLKDRVHEFGMRSPGMPCSVMVTSRSSLKMTCGVVASSHRPGSRVSLQAAVTRRGRGYDSRVQVAATVLKRGEQTITIPLKASGQGRFTGTFHAASSGVYQCLFRASGLTPDGQFFSREQTLTAQVWPDQESDADGSRRRESERDS
jgi:Mg-chelatase subunit ChlD